MLFDVFGRWRFHISKHLWGSTCQVVVVPVFGVVVVLDGPDLPLGLWFVHLGLAVFREHFRYLRLAFAWAYGL